MQVLCDAPSCPSESCIFLLDDFEALFCPNSSLRIRGTSPFKESVSSKGLNASMAAETAQMPLALCSHLRDVERPP